jgi:ligand-binding sensor domain-containing protein/two-component sensor histidine kinase
MSPARAAAAVLAAALLAAGPAVALDPQRATSQYVITKWGSGTLPSNTIHALLQTRDHYLWLGTTTGLVRFDGTSFDVFSSRNTPTIGDSGAYRLAEAADGSLFVGTSSGMVLRYHAGEFARLFMPPGTAYVTSLLAARDGSLWIGMHGQPMHRWSNGAATVFPTNRLLLAPYAIVEDAGGHVYVGARQHGLLKAVGDRLETVQNVTGDAIHALRFDRSGALWVGTTHGLVRFQDGKVRRFTVQDGLSHNSVSAILEDRDGNLWVGTAGGGLSRFRDGRWSQLTTRQGLSDDDVRSLLEDHEGNVWVGTADGLNCVSNGRFITYGRHEGLRDTAVQCVLGTKDGSVWIGTAEGEISRLTGGTIRHYPLPEGVGREAVISMAETRDASVWIALDNARLFQFKDERLVERTPEGARSGWKILYAYEDESGPVFYVRRGTASFARIVNGNVEPVTSPVRGFRYFHHALRDSEGRLWVGDLAGLGKVEDDKWTLYTTEDGLPHNRVRWMSLDADGGVWAATIAGLAYLKDGTIHKVTATEGLPENYLRFVQDDGLGHLWIASMGYIFRLTKTDVHDVFAGKAPRVAPLLFDTTDGLRTTEGLLSNAPGFQSPDGRLWFATGKGVSVVDPVQVAITDAAPPVKIEGLSVDGKTLESGDYPDGRGETAVDFTALSFRAPGKIRFRYRLEGLDADWIESGSRRRAYYSSLPPGRYTFTVMASNPDGTWNGPASHASFSIRPPFTRTPLFYGLVVLTLAAAGFAAYRIRVGQMRARFGGIIGERTRIARELHDTLAQGLAAVAFQIETAVDSLEESTQSAREHMQMADAMVRSSLAEVRRSIWVLRAQTSRGTHGLGESLSSSLSQITAESDVESKIAVTGRPRPLSIDVERNLLRIAHEAITNAVRHAEARSIAVDVQFGDDDVRLCVKDDGRGFDAEERARRRGDHFGLLGIEERARAVGGELRVTTAPGQGTEIVCRLPYHSRVKPAEGVAEDGEGIRL